MKYRKLGRTELKVSEIGFGGFGLGGGYDSAAKYGADAGKMASEAVRRAYDLGINFFDTCPFSYNITLECERLIGEAFKSVRDKVIYASKVERFEQFKNPVRACVEKALEQFGTDYLDLVQIRDPNAEKVRTYDILEEFETLEREGKIRFGVVTVGDTRIAEEARYSFDQGFAAMQLAYNLVFRDAEVELFDEALKTDTGIIARGPLCKGFLAQRDVVQANRNWFTEEENTALLKLPEELAFLTAEGRTLAQAAIQFVLKQPAVSTTIISFETAKDVEEAVQALEAPAVSEADWERAKAVVDQYDFIEY